jgi:hypothetical protein
MGVGDGDPYLLRSDLPAPAPVSLAPAAPSAAGNMHALSRERAPRGERADARLGRRAGVSHELQKTLAWDELRALSTGDRLTFACVSKCREARTSSSVPTAGGSDRRFGSLVAARCRWSSIR